MGAPATGSGNLRMLRSIVTYIRYLHINSGIERNGGRSHVGTAAPAVQASAARLGFRLSILALEGGARLPPLDSRGRGSRRFGWVRLAKGGRGSRAEMGCRNGRQRAGERAAPTALVQARRRGLRGIQKLEG